MQKTGDICQGDLILCLFWIKEAKWEKNNPLIWYLRDMRWSNCSYLVGCCCCYSLYSTFGDRVVDKSHQCVHMQIKKGWFDVFVVMPTYSLHNHLSPHSTVSPQIPHRCRRHHLLPYARALPSHAGPLGNIVSSSATVPLHIFHAISDWMNLWGWRNNRFVCLRRLYSLFIYFLGLDWF